MLDEAMNQWLSALLGRHGAVAGTVHVQAGDARAAVALPVHDAAGAVRAVVGLAWMDERELTDAQLGAIARDAASLP